MRQLQPTGAWLNHAVNDYIVMSHTCKWYHSSQEGRQGTENPNYNGQGEKIHFHLTLHSLSLSLSLSPSFSPSALTHVSTYANAC